MITLIQSSSPLPRTTTTIRAGGITVTWRIEWTEHPKTGIEQYRGGETTSKVSLLIEDIKEAAKTHGVDVRHIISLDRDRVVRPAESQPLIR